MAVAFETKRVMFAARLDLSADTDVAVEADEAAKYVYLENSGATRLFWRETTDEPDASDRGHILEPGAAIIALIYAGRNFWLWSATGGGEVTMSPAAPMPVRTA